LVIGNLEVSTCQTENTMRADVRSSVSLGIYKGDLSDGRQAEKDVIVQGRGRGYGRTYVRFSAEGGEGAEDGKVAVVGCSMTS